MSDTNGRYKKAPSRTKKTKPGRRITVSAETKKAYEDVVRASDERGKSYGRHLPATDRRQS